MRAWRGYDGLRGSLRTALVAVPHRDQRLPRHAQRSPAPGAADGPGVARRPPTPRSAPPSPSRSGCCRSLTVGCSPPTAIPPPWPRRARPSAWRSSPRSSTCRRASAPSCCCATSCAGRQPRSPSCSAPPTRRSTARSSAPVRPSPPATSPTPIRCCRWTRRSKSCCTRYVDAFERYDMESLTSLIHEDATQSMPPVRDVAARPRRDPHVLADPGRGVCRLTPRPHRRQREARLRPVPPQHDRQRTRSLGVADPRHRRRRSSSSSASSSTPRRCSRCSGCPRTCRVATPSDPPLRLV